MALAKVAKSIDNGLLWKSPRPAEASKASTSPPRRSRASTPRATASPPPSRPRRSRARRPARTSWSSRAPAPARPRPSASRSSRRSTPQLDAVQAVVLAPTRELAIQVAQEIAELGRGRGVKVESHLRRRLHGPPARGHPGRRPRRSWARPAACSTTCAARTLKFDAVKMLVLDEADRMLDMGFAVEMGQIMEYMPRGAADPAVLGHRAARHPRAHLPLPDRARVGAALRGPDLRQGGRAPLLPDPAPAQGGDALQAARVREPGLLDDLLQHRARRRGSSTPSWPARACPSAMLSSDLPAEEARAGDGAVPQRRDPPPGDDRRGLARHRHRGPVARLHLLDARTRPSSTSTAPAARAGWARAAARSASSPPTTS